MREVSRLRLVILCLLLLATSLLIHVKLGERISIHNKEPLHQVFARINGLQFIENTAIDPRIIEELKLDDYIFQSYGIHNRKITLYIGYYRSAKKIGAAHDPLVCFQGQGWQTSKRESSEYVFTRNPSLRINYSTMIAERQDDRQMIVYWFQANGNANANTYMQKKTMVIDKVYGRNEDNAFVRISTSIGSESPEVARKRLIEFIEIFYPDFYRFVTKT